MVLECTFLQNHLETHLSPAIRGGKPTLMMTRSLSANAEALAVGYANVIALDHKVEAGVEGTRMIIDKVQSFVPGVEFWDVHSFIAEVLEP